MEQREREHKSEWVKDKELRRDGMVLTIWVLPLRWPRYRFDVGCEGKEGKVFRGFMMNVEGRGKVRLSHGFNLDAMKALLSEAEAYVLEKAQRTEDLQVDRMIDSEQRDLSGGRHGSCGMGIGETVADFVALGDGLRAGDLTDPDIIQDKLKISQEFKRMQIRPLLEGLPWTEDLDREWDILNRSFGLLVDFYLDFAKRVTLVGDEFLEGALRSDKTIIFEGAQGVLLDQSFGWFPYVTRSTTTYSNAIDLLKGHPATRLGLLRTYSTRHGAGPFVTEDASLGHYEAHNGWGQWQEKFRQGHFDFVAVDYALRAIGGVDGIVLTHLDRMQGPQKVCVAYDPAVDLTLPETIPEQMRITEALGLTVPQYRMVDDLVQELGKLAPVVLTSHGPTAEDKHERKSHPRTAKDADRSSAWDEVRP